MAGRPESPLDPTAGPVQALAAELRKLRVEAGSPTYREMARRAGAGTSTLSQAAGGERLPSLPTVLAYARACGADPREWERRWHRAVREAAGAPRPAGEAATAPYRGLARFEAADHALFFGRDALVAQLTEAVHARRVVAVVGASGSGKSSLLRAGLVPALQAGEAGGRRPAAIRILTPGRRPLSTHGGLFAAASGAGDTVLVVDQFEELFTLCAGPAERGGFLDLLLSAAAEENRLRVVIAVRADFFGRCAEHPALADALRDATLLVAPMGPAALREAVVKPAAAAGLIVERALTARILREAAQEPGSLPLLSHALLETWRRRRGRALTEDMYEQAGGIHGAIAATAEEVYARLSPAHTAAARRILLRLVTPGDGTPDTRRPAARADLETGPAENGQVLEELLRARLLTLDGDVVGLAHEAVIQAWPRLRGWIEEDRDRLRLHRRLTEAAQAWQEAGRDHGILYRGGRLAAALDALTGESGAALTPLESAFLRAGERMRDQEAQAAARTTRRFRTLAATLSVLLVLAITAGLAAWNQRQAGDRSRQEARTAQQIALSRQLAEESTSLIGTDTDLGALLAVQAYRISPTTQAAASLYLAAAVPLRQRIDGGTDDGVTALTFDPKGRTLAWAQVSGAVRVADAAVGRPHTVLTGDSSFVASLAFRPDGRTLVTADGDARVRTFDLVTDRSRTLVPPSGSELGSRLGPDGGTMTVASDPRDGDRSVALWDTAAGRVRTTVPTRDPLAPDPAAASSDGITIGDWDATSSPDGRIVATPRTTGVALWDAAGRRARVLLRTGLPTVAVAFSSDGKVLATATSAGRVQTWDTASGRPLAALSPPGDSDPTVRALAFHPNGHVLAVSTEDGSIRLWDSGTGHTAAVLSGYHASVDVLAFSAGGDRLASGSDDGVVRVWDTTTEFPYATLTGLRAGHAESPVAFLPGGRTLATAAADGAIRLSDARGGASAGTLGTPGTAADFLVAGPDGRHLAAVTDDGALRLWDTGTGGVRTVGDPYASPALTAAFSPDGRFLTVADALGVVHTWDAVTGRSRSSFLLPAPYLAFQLAVGPDGRTLAAEDGDGAVRIMDAGTGRLRRGWAVPTVSGVSVPPHQRVMAFSPDGKTLATGGTDGSTRLWDVPTGRARAVLSVGASPVTSVAFSPDGRTLATASVDGAARLWDLPTGRVRASLTAGDVPLTSVQFSPDGRTLATSSRRGTAWLWHLDLPGPAAAAASICAAAHSGLTAQQRAQYLPGHPSAQSACADASGAGS